MAFNLPERVWWKPMHTEEKVWVVLCVIFGLTTFFFMPVWHMIGHQNPPSETYRLLPAQFGDKVNAFVDQYAVKEASGEVKTDKGTPIVHPPAGSDIYLMGKQWIWYPILELEKGKTYRLHLSTVDVEHGLSIYPLNMNFMALPGYDYVLTITPNSAGEFPILCNEFCGIGHHRMVGKMIVKE